MQALFTTYTFPYERLQERLLYVQVGHGMHQTAEKVGMLCNLAKHWQECTLTITWRHKKSSVRFFMLNKRHTQENFGDCWPTVTACDFDKHIH
jgi:hypothetical protein